jgi:AcrR family transcriptional regulator
MPSSPSVRIAGEIRRRIQAGELKVSEFVPSTREIAGQWGVAVATATRALALLRQEGLVEVVPGIGTRVAAQTHRRAPREPLPSLTQTRIVARAIAIADAEGLDALSMRRVAADLGVPTMSLYRHVASKEELVLNMADTAMGERPLPESPPAGWRRQLELVARLHWQGYERHQWLPHVISVTRPQLMPHGVAHTEWIVRALDGLGLDIETGLQAAITLIAFVRGMAVNLKAESEAEQETGLTADQWVESQSESMARFMDAGPYPLLSSATREADLKLDLPTLFEFGLARLLDGFASQFRDLEASQE